MVRVSQITLVLAAVLLCSFAAMSSAAEDSRKVRSPTRLGKCADEGAAIILNLLINNFKMKISAQLASFRQAENHSHNGW